ncbi:hypothetical protein VNI00_006799 [Paramarasmius palmivorus]|uniref:Uncharacterized protein n=1 Tax=Paramarasmius palmivorus TaxID=297713 RepID=A0AAW0D837_9AGAR
MTLPWGQIQHFRFRRRLVMFRRNPLTDSDKLCAIIRGLSNVKVCELDFDPGFSVSDMMAATSTSGRITTHLITLMVSGSLSTDPGTGRDRGDAVIPHFLEGISTPGLSNLQITSPFAGWDELLSLLRRSGCKLTVLIIPLARSLYPETLSEVLSTVPYLKTLEIGFATAMAGNISDNHIRTFSSPEVPRLEKLSIVRHPKHKLSYADTVLVDALEYRWKLAEDTASGASRLRFVSLDRRITDKRSRERLDALIAQGMAIDEHDG